MAVLKVRSKSLGGEGAITASYLEIMTPKGEALPGVVSLHIECTPGNLIKAHVEMYVDPIEIDVDKVLVDHIGFDSETGKMRKIKVMEWGDNV